MAVLLPLSFCFTAEPGNLFKQWHQSAQARSNDCIRQSPHKRNSCFSRSAKGSQEERWMLMKGIGNYPQLYQASHNKRRKMQSLLMSSRQNSNSFFSPLSTLCLSCSIHNILFFMQYFRGLVSALR